jgi:hypothetical protein
MPYFFFSSLPAENAWIAISVVQMLGSIPDIKVYFVRRQLLLCLAVLYTSLTRAMMQVNKEAKVMSNSDVMGRGPTNEVSRQTAVSHTKIQLRQTAGGQAYGTRYLFGLYKKYLMRYA